MVYDIIATGSDGNALIINDSILIDCGVPYKALKHHAKRLQLVLLTHAHSDHFNPATVKRLGHDRPGLRWGCCDWMVAKLLDAGIYRRQIDVYAPGSTVAYLSGNVVISPVELPHNVPNCGYKIMLPPDAAIFYATDTGTLDGITAKGFTHYFVEANHTRAEIEARAAEKEARGEFAYEVRAAENHLSYEQAVEWLMGQMAPESIWIPMHGHKDKGVKNDGGTPDVRKNDSPV